MKILMINTEFSRGGAALVARTLHNALNETPEFSSYFAYGRGTKVNNERTFKFASQVEVYFHAFLTRIAGLHGYGSFFSSKRLERFILRENFDLIHLHNLHGYYLNLSFVRFLGKLKIPIVWTLHDAWAITGRCAYSFDCEKWGAGCGNCPDLSYYPKTYFDSSAFMWRKKREYFTQGWNPLIVCPSQWLADKIKESYLNKFRIEVVPNGIDTELFKPKDKIEIREKLKLPFNKKVVLFVVNKLKEKQKGMGYLLKALKYVRVKNHLILFVGETIKADFPKTVRQLGYISDKNLLLDIYNSADIFCTTSFDESFGLTVTESMACGLPVVGFNSGAISEQVSADCGILVEPKNIKDLAMAIDELLNNDEKRKVFGSNCRKRALKNYSVEKFTDRYIALYREILNKNG